MSETKPERELYQCERCGEMVSELEPVECYSRYVPSPYEMYVCSGCVARAESMDEREDD